MINKYISVLGSSLINPIVTLFNELEEFSFRDTEDSPVKKENGYSVSIIVLCAILLESGVNRLIYNDRVYDKVEVDFGKARKYLESYIESNNLREELHDDFMEIMAVRDSIAHNHLWLQTLDQENYQIKESELFNGFGNKNFWNVTDKRSKKTKRNAINVIPDQIGKRDSSIVFVKTYNILFEIGKIERENVWEDRKGIRRKGRPFIDLVRKVKPINRKSEYLSDYIEKMKSKLHET